jgi:uncharacterized protein
MNEDHLFVSSRYNFPVHFSGGTLLYNSKTGAVISLEGKDAVTLGERLETSFYEIDAELLPPPLLEQLTAGGFIVPVGTDELQEIRQLYWNARRDTPIAITITTTQDCNLGCYYCYEERKPDTLNAIDIPAILALASEKLKNSGKKRLHVDWYGGEPLLNIDFMEKASDALQALCSELQVKYQASIISNGTTWPKDVGGFIDRHKIKQVQISFDGLKKNHDRRRHYRKGFDPTGDSSSFEQAIGVVDDLLYHTRVDVRFNIDQANQADLIPFFHFAKARGWFNRPYQATLQPARLSAYTEHSTFLRKKELTLAEYDKLRQELQREAGEITTVEESEVPDGFPFPKTSVCAALAQDSVVIGADKLKYRCGLQVGETNRSVGKLAIQERRSLPVLSHVKSQEEKWWTEFDPTTLPTCSRCSFLPICWGGCPKKHLEEDKHAIAEQSAYWRQNLPRLIAKGVGIEISPDYRYDDAHQFRQPL